MHVTLTVLLLVGSVLADDTREERRTKLKPFIADAVGNTLPPPSNGPATVGSPVNLLTPDRYEFYTFDESGELVKRLMTLEEIQAIVATGDDSEGTVTFANNNEPTIAFNFSQPSNSKVHSVVTNVQNVLKAQIEAHKNKPLTQPTLDTPDVSDSWSLILPSIFGNTGVEIIPDKSSGPFTTPETETFDLYHPETEENSISKESSSHILSSLTTINVVTKEPTTEKISLETEEVKDVSSTTTKATIPSTTTTAKPTTAAATKITTTTKKPTTTKATQSITSTTTTTSRLPSTILVTSTTSRPRVTLTSTVTPTTTKSVVSTTQKSATVKIEPTTKKPTSTNDDFLNKIETFDSLSNTISTTEKVMETFEKISTFIPVSTIKYVTERTTQSTQATNLSIPSGSSTQQAVIDTTESSFFSPTKIDTPIAVSSLSTTTFIYDSSEDKDQERINTTTITTQSVSPSTTVSSTEVIIGNNNVINDNVEVKPISNNDDNDAIKDNEPLIPLFDVAQSISQIASDLGGNYQPMPTVSNLLDVTKVNDMELESKEDIEMDMPSAVEGVNETSSTNNSDKSEDNFVKISTLDPHPVRDEEISNHHEIKITTELPENTELSTISSDGTTMDPILNESMEDLLSQVVNEVPQSIVDSENNSNYMDNIATTEEIIDTTTEINILNVDTTSQISIKIEKEIPVTTTETFLDDKLNIKNEIITEKISSVNDIKKNEPSIVENIKGTSQIENNKNYVVISVSGTNAAGIESGSNYGKTQNKSVANTIEISNGNALNEKKPEISDENKTGDENKDLIQTTENISTTIEYTTEYFSTTEDINQILDADKSTTNIEISTETSISTTINAEKQNVLPESNGIKIDSKYKAQNTKKETNNKIKNPEFLPKIDEYKKKIQKVNIADEELASERNNSWKLIPTVSPQKGNAILKDKVKSENHYTPENHASKDIVLEFSNENQGLEVTTKDLGEDIAQFSELCNELAFRYWNVMKENIEKKRSFVLSPYSITSMLAMMFMGARGATSGEMNEILKLDDMVTFNPHFTLKNISDSIEPSSESGVMVSAFIRELYSDRNKGKILTFYKERAQHFYNGHVEEINFKLISDIIRRRTNLLVKRYTWGRIAEYMKANSIVMQPPLAAFSANIFQTDCTGSSVEGRDGEMYFVVSPNVRQRRLVPVPAVVYKKGFLAGYDPVLDATAAAIGSTNSIISTLFLMPGQQGNVVHADDLEQLEQRLLDAIPTTPTWNRLLRTLLPRSGLELQIPRFSHKSIFNVSSTLRQMGLKDLFDAEHADLGGLNGPSKDLYLSDMIQMTSFVTCGEGVVGDQHHIEEYPENIRQRRRTSRWADWDEPRDYQRAFHDPHDVGEAMHLPLHLRPRQARLPARDSQPARLKFDRPFLYFVRHNPSGMILYVGRYNPRLLP